MFQEVRNNHNQIAQGKGTPGNRMRSLRPKVLGFLFSGLLFLSLSAYAYTDNQIADAIFQAEGGPKAKIPYGILSVKVKDEAEARKVCLNTVRNNRKRYTDYGYKQYDTYLEFLASRYAPVGAGNDPHNLNQNWIKNVKYFLEKGDYQCGSR